MIGVALAISLLITAGTDSLWTAEVSAGRDTRARASSVRMVLKPEAAVTSDTVRLGDIAEIKSATLAGKARLEAVTLGPAPLPGQTRPISLGYIKMRLRHAMLSPKQISFSGPDTVHVRRQAVARASIAPEAEEAGDQQVRLPDAKPLICRGDVVKVVLELQTICLRATAQALRSGYAGDIVSVRIQATNKVIEGTVAGPNTVRITL